MRAAFPLLLAGLVACEPPPDEEPLACVNDAPGTAQLGVGNLDTGFIPIEAGASLPVQFGPQGMHMVVVSVRTFDLERARAGGVGHRVEMALWEDGELVGGTAGELQPSAEEDEVVDFLGLRTVITSADIDAVGNREADLVGTVIDGCGRSVSTELPVWLQL